MSTKLEPVSSSRAIPRHERFGKWARETLRAIQPHGSLPCASPRPGRRFSWRDHLSHDMPANTVSGLLRQAERKRRDKKSFRLIANEGSSFVGIAAPKPRREHGSRLRVAHRRRRPQGLDARGALWPVVVPRALHDGRTAVVSSASSVEPVRLRAIMEIRARGANRLRGPSRPAELSAFPRAGPTGAP